jgi:hypothetical protein
VENNMDGTQFDRLIKRLATRPVTRSTALRGLATGAGALAGVIVVTPPSAAKKRNNNNDEPKRKVCHCSGPTGASCRTLKKEKSKVQRHLKKHDCDYNGKCQGFSGCRQCLNNDGCTGGQVCVDGACQDCLSDAQCGAGFDCEGGRCEQIPVD